MAGRVGEFSTCDRAYPATAPASTSQAGFTFQRSDSSSATAPSPQAGASTIVACPSFTTTAAISPTALTFTASRKAPIQADWRSRGTSGFTRATKMKEGRNTPRVATAAPAGPATM